MPYLHAEHTGQAARDFAVAARPWGLGLTAEQAQGIETIKHIASSFKDPGDDWNRFECYDAQGKLITARQENGY